MAVESKIQWTDATWNPWHGCKKVSPGCKYCYMYRDKDRFGVDPSVVIRSKTKFNDPLKWHEGKRIFTCSWSDFFIEDADQWIQEAWDIIRRTPQHSYQILTKRPERIEQCLPSDWGKGYENVWLGVSAENESQFRKRSQILCEIPAKVRFISAEPLLEGINMIPLFKSYYKGIHWVIIGGESGNETGKHRYRICDINWINQIIYDCQKYDVPVFVKQLGTHIAKARELKDRQGGNITEWPEVLKIRQMPNI